ncbi:MAG: histidine--tRNA ligase, partial [Sphingomonadaceae bacterium]|nr:histidine--tRNA ligase [Sphingomonadaceae bacterium]
VELLVMADQLLKELGIADGVTLMLNTLGDGASREAWRAALVEYFRAVKGDLSEDSQDRLERNPLRILDSKDPRDRAFVDGAPKIDDFLSDEAQDFFAKVTSGLDAAGVAWTRAPALVRGLDYYRHTAFEFVTDRLGAQGTVLGGGRYDGLMESLGGAPTPAVGWAAGVERLAMLVADAGCVSGDPFDVVLAIEDDAAIAFGTKALKALRSAGLAAEMVASGSPRKRFDKASKAGAKILVGVSLRDGKIACNTRSSGYSQDAVHVAALLESLEA